VLAFEVALGVELLRVDERSESTKKTEGKGQTKMSESSLNRYMQAEYIDLPVDLTFDEYEKFFEALYMATFWKISCFVQHGRVQSLILLDCNIDEVRNYVNGFIHALKEKADMPIGYRSGINIGMKILSHRAKI
jgi:hypothetical protein